MKKIKVKFKYLFLVLIIVLVTFLALPAGIMFYANKLSEKDMEASKKLYQKYISTFPLDTKKDEARFNLAYNILSKKGGGYFQKINTDGSYMGSVYINAQMLDTAIVLYKDILTNYQNSPYYGTAYNNLMFIYTYGARVNDGTKLIHEGLLSKNLGVRLTASKYSIIYNMANKNYGVALDIGNKLINDKTADTNVYSLIGNIYLLKGDFDKATSFFEKSNKPISFFGNENSKKYGLYMCDYGFEKISEIKKIEKEVPKNSKIYGSIKVNGKPIPFAYIYIKDSNDNSMNTLDTESSSLFGTTDYNGNYVINGVPAGKYMLRLVIPGVHLNNTVYKGNIEPILYIEDNISKKHDFTFNPTFKITKPIGTISPKGNLVDMEWEKVKGAAYYQITAVLFDNPLKLEGSCSWTPITSEIYSNKYTINIDDVNIMGFGNLVFDGQFINPTSYLGIFYSGCRVPLLVYAYDKNGLLITRSSPQNVIFKDLPIISINSNTNYKNDKFLLTKKPESYIKYFEDELKKNPKDLHSMLVLSNIYTLGTKVSHTLNPKPDDLGQNLKRAIELNNLMYELTGNPQYFRRDIYIHELFTNDYKKVIAGYGKIPSTTLSFNDYQDMGEAYLALNDFNAAEEYFDKGSRIRKYSTDSNISPFLLKLYFKDFDSALINLDSLNFRLYKVNKKKLHEDIISLKGTKYNKLEYKNFEIALKLVLTRRTNNNFKQDYSSIGSSIKSPVLCDILKQINSYYNYNTDFPLQFP